MGTEFRGQNYIPRHMTPSPVYPCLQVQVLSPAETFVQTAKSEHPPLDQLHISSSEKQREKKVIRFNICTGCVCVCVCSYLCSKFHCLHIQQHTHRLQLSPLVLLYSCSRGQTVKLSHVYTEAESRNHIAIAYFLIINK